MEMIERNSPEVEEFLLMFHNHISYECALLFLHFIFLKVDEALCRADGPPEQTRRSVKVSFPQFVKKKKNVLSFFAYFIQIARSAAD